jgi:hypothetical protein
LSSEMYDWVRNLLLGSHKIHYVWKRKSSLLNYSAIVLWMWNSINSHLICFWISVVKEYPVISAKAVKILLQFSTSYLWEHAFSCLANIESKDRNHLLSVEKELRECLLNFSQELQICAKRNKLKYHIKSKLYNDFECQLRFVVWVYFDLLFWHVLKARLDNIKKTKKNLWIISLICKMICIDTLYK